MRTFLIRLYPARWRARYGDEFEALLDERPLGPFDVADILLGALDAQLRLHGRGADVQHGRGLSMSLRIGGMAAVIGSALWAFGLYLGSGLEGADIPLNPMFLMVTGSIALLVALVGLSAFQARTHPRLAWAAFALPAVGRSRLWESTSSSKTVCQARTRGRSRRDLSISDLRAQTPRTAGRQ